MSEPVGLPEWIATLIGRLTLENEALRRALADMEAAATKPEPSDDPL